MLIQRWLDELIERVDNRMFSVRPEHDVWHDNSAPPVPATETAASSGETSGVYEFLVGSDADKTLHVKREDLRTCRPDLLVLCRMLIREVRPWAFFGLGNEFPYPPPSNPPEGVTYSSIMPYHSLWNSRKHPRERRRI